MLKEYNNMSKFNVGDKIICKNKKVLDYFSGVGIYRGDSTISTDCAAIERLDGKNGLAQNNWCSFYKDGLDELELVEDHFKDLPAKEQGIDTSRYFTVVKEHISVCNLGDLLKLNEDDNSICPYFDDLTDKNIPYRVNPYWCNLRYATQEEIDKVVESKEEKINMYKMINNSYEKLYKEFVEKPEDYFPTLNVIGPSGTTYFDNLNNNINKPNKKTIMSNIIEFAKNLTLSKEEKLLRKAGLKVEDEDGKIMWTDSAVRIVLDKEAVNRGYKNYDDLGDSFEPASYVSIFELDKLVKENEQYLIDIATQKEAEEKK